MQGLILNAKHPITININVEKYLFIQYMYYNYCMHRNTHKYMYTPSLHF